MSRSQLLLAIAFVCLMLGWLELSDQPIHQSAGVVLRQIEETTALGVTQLVESVERATGLKLPKPSNHTGSGKSVQQIMQEELAERQAIEEAQLRGKLIVTLQRITFQGATILGDRELSETVAKYLGVPMEYEQMLEIGMAVETYYRQNNYLARVILPPQDLSGGVLQLEVIESVISKIEVEQQLAELPDTKAHVTALIAQQPVAVKPPVNTKKMERSLAFVNNVPGVSVQASLKEGKTAGDAELLLKMYQTRTMDSDITVDNAGSRSTGAIRVLAYSMPMGLEWFYPLLRSNEGSEFKHTSARGITDPVILPVSYVPQMVKKKEGQLVLFSVQEIQVLRTKNVSSKQDFYLPELAMVTSSTW